MTSNETAFGRTVAISAMLAGLMILGSVLVLSMAVNFNFDFMSAPADLISAGLEPSAANLFTRGSILELLGSFLLFIPICLYLWFWLEPRSPKWVTLYTLVGLISIVIGVLGASIRGTMWPSLMIAYPQAAEAQQDVLAIIFRAFTDFTFAGLYGLDSILAGVWFLGIGLVMRAERRALGITTAIMGAAILGTGLGWLLGIDLLARLEAVYFLQPFWVIWLGIVIYRRDTRQPAIEAAERAELQGA